jgi:hypothetical protein
MGWRRPVMLRSYGLDDRRGLRPVESVSDLQAYLRTGPPHWFNGYRSLTRNVLAE